MLNNSVKIIDRKKISLWILSIVGSVFIMLIIGGITRLTQSGLSIVEWKPITGIIPPFSENEWAIEFQKYQLSPQFLKINFQMSLAEFKQIYFWEYIHRLWGRMIALIFIVPFAYFIIKRQIHRSLGLSLFFGFLLGGLQGILGWYMVKSGLVNHPEVSHYRLAAHFILAVFIMLYFLSIKWKFDYNNNNLENKSNTENLRSNISYSTICMIFFVISILQLVWGAFMAGKKGGMVFNSFPLIDGTFLPTHLFSMDTFWQNISENLAGIHFVHRYLGLFVWVFSFFNYFYFKKIFSTNFTFYWAKYLLALCSFQVVLGIMNIYLKAPIILAVLHQMFGVLTVIFIYKNYFILKSVSGWSRQSKLLNNNLEMQKGTI